MQSFKKIVQTDKVYSDNFYAYSYIINDEYLANSDIIFL